MTCVPLPDTGLDATFAPLLLLGTLCLVAGALLLLAREQRNGAVTTVVVLLVAGAAATVGAPAPAQAAASSCSTGQSSPSTPTPTEPGEDTDTVTGETQDALSVTQTSTLAGLAPGVDPLTISGQVLNNAIDSIYLTEVEVEIVSVTPAPGSPAPGSRAGACDASDYVLLDTTMPVGRALGPGESTPFTGAAIGFRNKSTNQDACKNATVLLRYTANPG